MEIILKGVNPSTFNLVASLLAEVLQLAGAFTLCAFVQLMVSIYMRNGNKLPVTALGPLPEGLIAAWHYARATKWAWPAILALFLFISDYSTAIAFAGLGFVEVDQEGPQSPVLNLTKRNNLFPYEVIGDPSLPFTASELELLLESPLVPPTPTSHHGKILKLSREEAIVASFLGAADSIAQGSSIFLEQSDELINDPTLLLVGQDKATDKASLFSEIQDSTVLHGASSSLAEIHREIPLDCSSSSSMKATEDPSNQDEWMTEIEEHRGPDNWTRKSNIPNCTFTALRASGIYDRSSVKDDKVKITAYARVGSGSKAKLWYQEQQVHGSSTFVFPYEGLYLARERNDFREGRRVYGFGGVEIGNTTILFDTTVVASGQSLTDPPLPLDPEDLNNVRTREYFLISKVKDQSQNCPPDPSGAESSMCMVTTKIICETFGSEVGFGGLLNGYGKSKDPLVLPAQLEHNCVFDGQIEIIWGANYDVDLQLIAAVAGVYSRNAGWASSLRQKRTLSIHSIPSALFVLGVLDQRSSIEQVQSTTIDGIFIAFMCVPTGLCLISGFVYLFGLKYLLALPDNGEALIKLGQQNQSDCIGSGWLSWSNEAFSLESEQTLKGKDSGDKKEENEQGQVIDVDDTGSEARDEKPQNELLTHATLRLFGIHVDNLVTKFDSPRTEVGADNKCEEGLGVKASDPSKTCETSRTVREFQNTRSANHVCLTFLNGTGFYVACCMIFCMAVTLLGTAFIKAKEVFRDESSQASPEFVLPDISSTNFQDEPPCFRSNNELRAVIYGYLHGSTEDKRSVVDKYGAFEEWCIDLVDDFSFLFSGLPKEHSLNGSNWDVSHVKKFSFCFFNAENVFDVSHWNVSRGEYFHGMFYGASNFNSDLSIWNVSSGIVFNSMFQDASSFDADISNWDISSGTDLVSMFRGASSFNSNLNEWNVSGVSDFGYIFARAKRFKTDISLWDVSSGTSFAHMFDGASLMNSDLSLWNVSSATDFSWMFNGATSFNSNLSMWDVSSAKSFRQMFSVATSFNSDLSQWNVSSVTDFSYIFQGAANFQSDISLWDVSFGIDFSHAFDSSTGFNSNLSQWDVSSATSFAFMFNGATSFNSNISSWDVSSGTNFGYMFYRAVSFNSDLSRWDVSSGTDFSYMFFRAMSFNSDLSQWDVSSGNNFFQMFDSAGSFNSNLSQWDVSAGTNFGYMFSGAISFNSDLSKWDVSSGTDFGLMFYDASSFNSNLSEWDVSSGTNFGYMFYGAGSFNSDLSYWDVSSGTDFGFMFYRSGSFSSDLSQWDVSSVTNFGYMFYEAGSFNSDLSQWDVSSGKNFGHMFYSAGSFNSDLSQWDVSSGTDFGYMFSLTESFNSDLSRWDVSSGTDFGSMFRSADSFKSDLSKWDVSSGTDFGSMFSSLISFNSDLSQWDVSSGTDFGHMFYEAGSFNSDLSKWDVSSGTNFGYMFYFAFSFTSDLSQWDVSSGTDFGHMFYHAFSFNSALSQWDVSSGTDFRLMFFDAASFNSNLSEWDVSSGTNFGYMFYGAVSFNSDLSLWDVSSGTDFGSMFLYADSFNSDLSQWDVSSGTDFRSMFRSADSFNSDLSRWDVSSGTDFSYMFNLAEFFSSDLCSWFDQMDPGASTDNMFHQSGCLYQFPSVDEMCQSCSPSSSPSQMPSQGPTFTNNPTSTASPSNSPSFSNAPTLSQFPTQAPSSSTSPTICVDIVGWVDTWGDGCEWYSLINYCSSTYANNGVSSYDACCHCGGGDNKRKI